MIELVSPVITQGRDIIPEGTFYGSEYESRRIAALKKVIEIGNQVSGMHPEVAEMYTDTELTNLQIAESIIPEEVVVSPGVAAKAIGYAIRSMLSEEELAEATSRRRSAVLEKRRQALGEEGFRAHQREASRKRHELHGVDVEAMLIGRGRTAWTDEEREAVIKMSQQSEFQHSREDIAGRPNYSTIAFVINELFHNGQEIRYSNSVASLVRDIRRKKKQS